MVLAIAYGGGSAALLALLVLTLLGSRPEGAGKIVILSCLITFAWALASVFATQHWAGLTQILEDAHSAAWLYFLGGLLETAPNSRGTSGLKHARAVALGLGAVAVANDARFADSVVSLASFDVSQVI